MSERRVGGVAATVITRAGDRGHHIIMGGISGYKRAVHVIKAAAAAGWEKEAMCSVAKRSRRAGRDAGGAVAMQEASMRDPRWGGRRGGRVPVYTSSLRRATRASKVIGERFN